MFALVAKVYSSHAEPLGPVEGPDLPSQYNMTFERDPNVGNGTVIIVLKDKDEPAPASLRSAIEIKKKYDGISKGVLLAKVSVNDTIVSTIEKAMADPSVKYAEPNYILRASDLMPNDPNYDGNQWNMPKISMPKAWDYSKGGSDVLVCVIDTGIDYTHPDLAPNMARGSSTAVNGLPSVSLRKGFNAITNGEDAMDDKGHGTHCAGVIGAKGNNNLGIAGINWSVKLTGCKFLSARGNGYTSDALQCLDWCVNGVGATISSNSWGGEYSRSMKDAIAAAGAKQHIFIASAGNNRNNNDNIPSYPASYPLPNIMSVAATSNSDALADFSNYGATSVHIAAPGVDIYSTIPTAAYVSYSGTSMACPHVAGAAAMLRGIDSSLTAQDIKKIIMSNGDLVSGLTGKVVGGKRLNVGAAVEYVVSRTPPVSSTEPEPSCSFSGTYTIRPLFAPCSKKYLSYKYQRGCKSKSRSITMLPSRQVKRGKTSLSWALDGTGTVPIIGGELTSCKYRAMSTASKPGETLMLGPDPSGWKVVPRKAGDCSKVNLYSSKRKGYLALDTKCRKFYYSAKPNSKATLWRVKNAPYKFAKLNG